MGMLIVLFLLQNVKDMYLNFNEDMMDKLFL